MPPTHTQRERLILILFGILTPIELHAGAAAVRRLHLLQHLVDVDFVGLDGLCLFLAASCGLLDHLLGCWGLLCWLLDSLLGDFGSHVANAW